MVCCGIFETRISANAIFLLKIGLHILCNQFRHTASQNLEVLNTDLIFTLILKLYTQIPPVVHFLPVTTIKKRRRAVNLFLNIAGVYL